MRLGSRTCFNIFFALVGSNDCFDQAVTHHIFFVEFDMCDTIDIL